MLFHINGSLLNNKGLSLSSINQNSPCLGNKLRCPSISSIDQTAQEKHRTGASKLAPVS
jgi:hypothetical protein